MLKEMRRNNVNPQQNDTFFNSINFDNFRAYNAEFLDLDNDFGLEI